MEEGFVETCWNEAEEEVIPEEEEGNSEIDTDEENQYLQMENISREIEL